MDFENLTQSDIMDAINSGNLVGPETDNPNDIFASAIINGETLLGSRTVKKQEAPAVKDVAAQPQAQPAAKPATKPDAPEDPVVREARLDSIAKTRTKLDAIPPKNRRMPVPGKTDARNARVPLIDDPDWKKTSAMKLTAGVNNMQDRDDIHAAYKMLNGDVPVDANALRNIYERMSTSKSDGAKYLRQTLGTVFARSTRDFYTSLRTDPSVIRGVSSYGEASRVVIEQMKKAFGGNDGLLEMYIGTQEGQSALDRGVGFVLQAEKEDLSLEKDRTAIDSNKALAEMRRAGGSSPSGYSPQAPIVYGYTTAMDSGKKSESADAINKIRPGAGDTLKVMDDFVSSEDVSSYGNESLVGLREEDIASTVSAIQSLVVRDSATISTKGALETAIIQSFESVYGEIDPGQRGSVLRAVKDHNGGKWVDDIAKGVTDQMNAAYESVSMSHLSHVLDFDKSSGIVTGLSDIYKNRDSGEYGDYLNSALRTINGMIAKGQLDKKTNDDALDAAIVLATRDMLADTDRVTGFETYYPDTPEGVESNPDIRLKRAYSELRPYFEKARAEQREFRQLNIDYATATYEHRFGVQPESPVIFKELGDKEVFVALPAEDLFDGIAASNDPYAKEILERSVKNGVLDSDALYSEVYGYGKSKEDMGRGVRRLAEFKLEGMGEDDQRIVYDFYRNAEPDSAYAISNPNENIRLAAPSKEEVAKVLGSDDGGRSLIYDIRAAVLSDKKMVKSPTKLSSESGYDTYSAYLTGTAVESLIGDHNKSLLAAYNSASDASVAARRLIESGDERRIKQGVSLLYGIVRHDAEAVAKKDLERAKRQLDSALSAVGVAVGSADAPAGIDQSIKAFRTLSQKVTEKMVRIESLPFQYKGPDIQQQRVDRRGRDQLLGKIATGIRGSGEWSALVEAKKAAEARIGDVSEHLKKSDQIVSINPAMRSRIETELSELGLLVRDFNNMDSMMKKYESAYRAQLARESTARR